MKDLGVGEIFAIFEEFISRRVVGREVIDALFDSESRTFVPKESEFWDYKREADFSAVGLAKIVRQIVGFYNSFGGYLIYGVDEKKKDALYEPVAVSFDDFNQAKLRDTIRNYTGEYIDISFATLNYQAGYENYTFGLLQIPKRPVDRNNEPVQVVKRGPQTKNGKFVFEPDDVFFRQLDETKKAEKPADWSFLCGQRKTDSILYRGSSGAGREEKIQHNLPDASAICSRLIGRDNIISRLWEWVGCDDLIFIKILAGDGGKGKTSIAYHFARQFKDAGPVGYERVVWLAAKESQFSGADNDYFSLPPIDYDSYVSFLQAIGSACGLDQEELATDSERHLLNLVKDAISNWKMLAVVDNLDSVDDDSQKKIVDACRALGAEDRRFVLTTRKKFAYSSDVCIEVPGLEKEEYKKFLEMQCGIRQLPPPANNEVLLLWKELDGSPLLSDSVLRLVRLGSSYVDAMQQWKGHTGRDARRAVLKVEIDSLSPDAKRLLLIASYFKSCSQSELKSISALGDDRLHDCIDELQSLFLIGADRIIESEARFSVSAITSLLVHDVRDELAVDFAKLENEVQRFRSESRKISTANIPEIGSAINQANALLSGEKYSKALETVESAERRHPGNKDLLLMKGKVLLTMDRGKNAGAARSLFEASYSAGQRKELLFDMWYEMEEYHDSPLGMIDVANFALESRKDDAKWYYLLCRGLISKAVARQKSGNTGSAIDELREASKLLLRCIESDGENRDTRIQESKQVNEYIWRLVSDSSDLSPMSKFDILAELISNGDIRSILFERAVASIEVAGNDRNLNSEYVQAIGRRISKWRELASPLSDVEHRKAAMIGWEGRLQRIEDKFQE